MGAEIQVQKNGRIFCVRGAAQEKSQKWKGMTWVGEQELESNMPQGK